VSERREETGRRRRRFRLTKAGQRALEEWRKNPTVEFTELRDPGLLQLFFGAEAGPLARLQLAAHEARLSEYEELATELGEDAPLRIRRALNAGIGHEREWVRFWTGIHGGGDGAHGDSG
jgi:DNA-binding MarR family transcriptional regulator